MPTSSIFTNVKITDPKKAEAFINAIEEQMQNPRIEKEPDCEIRILTDRKEIRKRLEKRLGKNQQ